MKHFVFYLIIFCSSCVSRNPEKKEKAIPKDDSVTQNFFVDGMSSSAEERSLEGGTTAQEKPLEYTTDDKNGFLYNPYDFELDAEVIKDLLGNDIEIKTEYFEGDVYGGDYILTTIVQGDTRIRFYDYEGKHEAKITTAKLPLLNGIKIGMDRKDFIKVMNFNDNKAKNATIFNMVDDFGAMTFSFRSDTLYLIQGHYEEGD